MYTRPSVICQVLRFSVRTTGPGIFEAITSKCLTTLLSGDSFLRSGSFAALTCPMRIIALTIVDFPAPVSPMTDKKLGYVLELHLLPDFPRLQSRGYRSEDTKAHCPLDKSHFLLGSDGLEGLDISRNTDIELEFYPEWSTKKLYVCPREMKVHKRKPDTCGKDCKRAKSDADDTQRGILIKNADDEEENCVWYARLLGQTVMILGLVAWLFG